MILRLFPIALACALAQMAGAQDRWSLATDDTLLGIALKDGQLAVTSFSSGAGASNWIGTPIPIPLPDHVFINNAAQPVHWKFFWAALNRGGAEIILHFSCSEPKLELLSIWQAATGPGPVEHHFEIVNRSGQMIEVPLQPSLAVALTAPAGHSLENWWVEKGGSRPSDAGTHREPISTGYQFKGRSTPYAHASEMIPWLSIQDTTAHVGCYFGIEFSGRVAFDLGASGPPLQVVITAGLDPSEREFRSRLLEGECFTTPTVFLGCYRGALDDGANRLHRFVADHLRPPAKDVRYPLVVNNSWGSGMAVDEKLARRMIDDSAALGCEMFHLDAGWFRAVGDWQPGPAKFPHGLAPVSDCAHNKGMAFGLWVGWTQGGTDSAGPTTLAATNPDQRDWFARDYLVTWEPAEFTGATVCLGDPAACDWCLKELRRIITACKPDMLEHDQMMIVDECVRTNHSHTTSPGDIAYHATLGYYSIYDQLRDEHPNLLFEDCVNGGHTVDFGIVRRTHYISLTDTYDPLSNRRAFYDASFPLPPAMCECYVENHPGPSLATFKTMLRSGMMGWCTLMCDTGAWSVDQRKVARRQIQIYKQWIRPLINEGNLYHISARPDEAHWDGMEYFDAKTGRGVVFAFRGTKADERNHVFELRGLDRQSSYEIWSEDGSLPRRKATGAELMDHGMKWELNEPGASDLIYLQRR